MAAALPLALGASPRSGGNTDAALQAFVSGVESAGGRVESLQLRRYDVLACAGCNACGRPPHVCLFQERDQAYDILPRLLEAPFVFLASPIYFYHVPAGFKALIDRGQAFYLRKLAGDPALDVPDRPALVSLHAGRERGGRLFDGALLTLRYFLDCFRLDLARELTFRGVDDKGEMAANTENLHALEQAGAEAWRTWGA
jgi:multimeric flavodoxin WrbA